MTIKDLIKNLENEPEDAEIIIGYTDNSVVYFEKPQKFYCLRNSIKENSTVCFCNKKISNTIDNSLEELKKKGIV